MDAVIAMIVETVVYLLTYLVDFLKWWRFICAMLAAVLVFVGCCLFGVFREGGALLALTALLVSGAVIGIFFEWYVHRKSKRTA